MFDVNAVLIRIKLKVKKKMENQPKYTFFHFGYRPIMLLFDHAKSMQIYRSLSPIEG